MKHYDCIVLGVGGVGSAAAYHLARRGLRVLGLERHGPAHDRGSSHGETRVIRLAYFEHPDYVPLLRPAFRLWEELDARRPERLYEQVGLLEVGPQGGTIISGLLRSAEEHDLDVERLDAVDVSQRFGGFRVPEGSEAVYESRAGYLRVEDCVRAHIEEAQRAGAELRFGEAVCGWSVDGDGVLVTTARSGYRAARLVVTAGAWAGRILRDLRLPLRVRRKSLFWFATDDPQTTQAHGAPCFFYDTPGGMFYGFPATGALGLKVAEHTGGDEVTDPATVDRELRPRDERAVLEFLREHIPGVSARRTRHAVCMYTDTPDEQFVVDVHPRHPQVSFAAGLSGHGFKFASVLGEIMADLAQRGATRYPIGFLGCQRFLV